MIMGIKSSLFQYLVELFLKKSTAEHTAIVDASIEASTRLPHHKNELMWHMKFRI
jgi:hypothetical protein